MWQLTALALILISGFLAEAQMTLFKPMDMNLMEAIEMLDSSRYHLVNEGKRKGLTLTVFQAETGIDSTVLNYRSLESRPRRMVVWYQRYPEALASQISQGDYQYSIRLKQHGYIRNTNHGQCFTWYDRDFERWFVSYVFEGW